MVKKNILLTIVALLFLLFITGCAKSDEYIVKKIVDDTEFCDSALELFYVDSENEYYFGCIRSSNIIVYYTNSKKEKIVDALMNGRITIQTLDEYGIHYFTYPKDGE